jgi:hypothetical protein
LNPEFSTGELNPEILDRGIEPDRWENKFPQGNFNIFELLRPALNKPLGSLIKLDA